MIIIGRSGVCYSFCLHWDEEVAGWVIFSLLVSESGLQLPALSVGYLWETRVVSKCKYLHPILQCSFSAINLLQFNSAQHVRTGFTFTCAFVTCVSPWSRPRVRSCSPGASQYRGGARCVVRQPGALWSRGGEDVKERFITSSSGGGRGPEEDRARCLNVYLLSSDAGWSHHFIFSAWLFSWSDDSVLCPPLPGVHTHRWLQELSPLRAPQTRLFSSFTLRSSLRHSLATLRFTNYLWFIKKELNKKAGRGEQLIPCYSQGHDPTTGFGHRF